MNRRELMKLAGAALVSPVIIKQAIQRQQQGVCPSISFPGSLTPLSDVVPKGCCVLCLKDSGGDLICNRHSGPLIAKRGRTPAKVRAKA